MPWILGIGCLFVVLLCAGIPGGCAYWAYNFAINNSAVQSARDQVAQSAEVQQALGAPVEVGKLPTNTNNNDQSFDYQFPVSGPNGSGTVHLTAEVKSDLKTWTVTELSVTTDSGEIVLVGQGGNPELDEVFEDDTD